MSTNALGKFLTKLSNWKFCPPSDNLWTVAFLLSPRSDNKGNSFSNLYANICSVNASHKSMYGNIWNIISPVGADIFVANTQDDDIGSFLATEVQYNVNKVNLLDDSGQSISQHIGFLNFGKIQTGKSHNHDIKIRFLKSNWDINELFFDRWIAAVGQQGLIEAEGFPNIKATIVLQEYSASVPGGTSGVWFPRKQITLFKAVPYERDDYKLSYDNNEAGTFKDSIITFKSDSYHIKYHNPPTELSFTTNTASNDEIGILTPSTAEGTSEVGPTITKTEIDNLHTNTK